jgi:hypothetical protein
MNRFLFAAAIGFLFAASATADPPVASAPVTGTAPAVVASGVPTPTVVNTLTTTPRRMGLLARLRARNTNPTLTTSAAFSTSPMVTPGVVVPSTTAVPAPMPAVTKPSGTSSATPGVTGAPVVVGGTGAPVVVGGMTTTSTEMMTTSTSSRRMGLIARLRMRRE